MPTTRVNLKPPTGRMAQVLALVGSDLEIADQVFADTLSHYGPPIDTVIQHLKNYRGKRLRPALLFLAGRAVGSITPAHATLAAAIEMIHTATLVHDDVLDEAQTRRHCPTVHAVCGNKRSILLGDLLFTHSFHLTSRVDRFACEAIGEATNRVCAGELLQNCEIGNWNLTEKQYFTIIDGKTASLTELAAQLGGHYAGASESVALRLAKFGNQLGRAFQIADDLLDVTGEELTTGKTLGTDLIQHKPTLPVIHAMSVLDTGRAGEFQQILQSNDRLRVMQMLMETNSIVYAKRKAEECLRTARTAIDCLPRSEYRDALEMLTEWTIQRDK